MVERLLVWEKWREDRGVVAKECEQYAERLVGYVRKRLLILIRRVVVRRSTYDVYCGRHTRVLRPQYTHATRRIPREKCESHAMPTPLT